MVRYVLVAVALAATTLLASASPAPAHGEQGEAAFRTTTLNLSSEGEVRIRPEVVTFGLGATYEAPSARQASGETNRRANRVVQALRRAGVAQRDIQTQSLNLTPRYSDASGQPRKIVAYQATTMLSVVVRTPDRAGALLDIAMAAGANQVSGVRYGLSDPASARRAARDLALQTLRQDAARVADIMGYRVVRLVSVGSQTWAPVATSSRISSGSNIEAGELGVRASASGVFELARK